jgi:hypothetical protein
LAYVGDFGRRVTALASHRNGKYRQWYDKLPPPSSAGSSPLNWWRPIGLASHAL